MLETLCNTRESCVSSRMPVHSGMEVEDTRMSEKRFVVAGLASRQTQMIMHVHTQ